MKGAFGFRCIVLMASIRWVHALGHYGWYNDFLFGGCCNHSKFSSDRLSGLEQNVYLFLNAIFSIGEMLVLDRLVMKRSLSSANYLKILFFMNRLDFEQVREKRLAFRWDCEMWARLVTLRLATFLESRVYFT